MIKVSVDDLSCVTDNGYDSGGGYTDNQGNIYIDASGTKDFQLECLFHEVIDGYILRRKSNRIRHKDIDPLALELIDALKQWEEHHGSK